MIDSEWWNAVITNDQRYDGKFFYGVKSTGIFCRPSCASKPPKPENAIFSTIERKRKEPGFGRVSDVARI